MTLEHVAGGFGLGGPKVVLIVSDDTAALDTYTDAVTRAGHTARPVHTARAAHDLALTAPINLALIDACLRDEEGVILGQSLWLDHGIPFVQIAAAEETEVVRRAIAHGALQCLVKSLAVPQLKVAIEVALVQGREFARMRRTVERLSRDVELRNTVSIEIGRAHV